MKKVLSLILVIVMLCSTFAGLRLTAGAAGKKASALAQGETFYMGRWPQSRVTDSSLLSSLNTLSVKLWSYEYKHTAYSDTNYKIVDMSFGDVSYGGEVYRKVVLNQYRPSYTKGYCSSGSSNQDDNGYTISNTYWFRWDPIKWKTLKAEGDGTYVMADLLLDSQPYNDIRKDITWAESTLRAWLSKNFYQSAFSATEKGKIVNFYHENENSPQNSSVSGGAATTDKVWLLSYSDAVNSAYGFSSDKYEYDTSRRAQGSDYAKSQGLSVSTSSSYYGNSHWWLRSPGYNSRHAACVYSVGRADDDSGVDNMDGVRPAFKINPSSIISGSSDPAETGRIFHGSISYRNFYPLDYESVHKDKTVTVDFYAGLYEEGFSNTKLDIKWDFSMFGKTAYLQNNDIAVASLVLATGAYDLPREKGILKDLGFPENRTKDYNYDYYDQPSLVGNVMASTVELIKGKKTNVIVIACRGTTGGFFDDDWRSNKYAQAQGFRDAAVDIEKDFENYIQGKNEYGISFGKDFGGKIDTSLPTKILITGHSRGAAVANILSTIIPSYIAEKGDIYTYTFASPNLTNEPGRENYGNIRNILCSDDIVTQVPLIYDSPFEHTACPRFGTHIWFNTYDDISNFEYYFEKLTGINSFNLYKFSSIQYCKKNNKLFDTVHGNFTLEPDHAPGVYMAFLLAQGIDDYHEWNFSTKRISVECPVDVSVYDSTGKLLGTIKDNVADDNLLKNGIIPVIEGDKKYLYTTSDKEIVLKLTGTDSGQMKYTVSDIDVNTGEVSNKKEFSGISLENNKTMLSGINVDTATQDTKLLVTNNDSIVKEIDDNGTETDAVVITFDTKEGDSLRDVVIQKGTAPGALPEAKLNGYQFAGWYTDEECKNAFDNTVPLNESITLYAAYTHSQAVFAGINSLTYDGSELKAEMDFEYNQLNGQLVTVLCKDGKMIACKYSSVSENDTQTAVTIPVSGLSGLYSLKLYSLDSNGEFKPAGKALEYDTAFYADYLYAGNKDTFAANAAVPELTKNGNTIAPGNTVVDNYVFKGWFTGETFESQFDFDSAAPENITLYAKWDFADDWDEPFYTWAKDYSTCTASRINTLNPNVVQRETVDVMVQSTATCTSAGEADYTTLPFENAAFEVQTKRMAVGAAGHKQAYPVTENEHAATCTKSGSYESVIYCSVCGEEMSREKVDVNALGHDFSDNAEVCRNGCGTANPDYIPPVPAHVHDYQEVVTAPKANAFGYTQYKCACGEWQTDEAGEVIKTNYTSPTGKVTGLKCTARTAAAMKFTWKKVAGVRGYQVQLINAKGAQAGLKTLHENVYAFTKLASGHAYKARVRLYVKDADGNYYFGPWSAIIKSPTLPNGTALTGLARAKKAFTAKWKKGACTGYQLQFGRKANFAGAKTVTFKNVKTVKYTAKKLTAKKYYYVRIRTYKKIAGKNYFSAWSKTYKVKTK